jgi:Putative phage abortive infection protein
MRPWYREYTVEILIFVGGVAAVNAIFISKAFRQGTTVNPEAAGQLGSFVGGYVGAIFALTGVLLLYRTLRNEQRTSKLQNFETKYFELIKMHRDNVAELQLQSVSGRRIFVWLIRELRSAHEIIRHIASARNYELTHREQLHIAYYCLFFGVGPNSSRMLKMSLSNFDATFVDVIESELSNSKTKERAQMERGFPYVPFEGHQSRLGHYYRHLYQMVRYVDQQQIDINKYEYVKTMRAQLSTHEQALLLVNSLTPIGQNWWLKNLMLPYRLVGNIPRDFFDRSTELDADGLFGPKYFEWQEVDS